MEMTESEFLYGLDGINPPSFVENDMAIFQLLSYSIVDRLYLEKAIPHFGGTLLRMENDGQFIYYYTDFTRERFNEILDIERV